MLILELRVGGAISMLDALYVTLNIPSATIKVVTHGMPRIGNKEFADFVDNKVGWFVYCNA